MTAAALVIAAFVALCVVCAVVNAVTRQGPRPESLSERNHRLDAEARRSAGLDANVAARWQG